MREFSSRKKLVDYFKKNLRKGYPVTTLRFALINQGYLRHSIDEAARQAIKEMATEAPVLKEKPKIAHEIIDEYDKPITIKKSFWKKIADWFGF